MLLVLKWCKKRVNAHVIPIMVGWNTYILLFREDIVTSLININNRLNAVCVHCSWLISVQFIAQQQQKVVTKLLTHSIKWNFVDIWTINRRWLRLVSFASLCVVFERPYFSSHHFTLAQMIRDSGSETSNANHEKKINIRLNYSVTYANIKYSTAKATTVIMYLYNLTFVMAINFNQSRQF